MSSRKTSASIYGGTSSLKTIYGAKKNAIPEIVVVSECVPEDICLTKELLLKFYGLVEKVKEVVGGFNYGGGSGEAKSMIITKIKTMAFMNDYTYVRFLWIKRHPHFQFDPTNMTSRWDLYYYYREIGSDKWKYDPLTNSLPGVTTS